MFFFTCVIIEKKSTGCPAKRPCIYIETIGFKFKNMAFFCGKLCKLIPGSDNILTHHYQKYYFFVWDTIYENIGGSA